MKNLMLFIDILLLIFLCARASVEHVSALLNIEHPEKTYKRIDRGFNKINEVILVQILKPFQIFSMSIKDETGQRKAALRP
jgi:hypothetical protein